MQKTCLNIILVMENNCYEKKIKILIGLYVRGQYIVYKKSRYVYRLTGDKAN